MIYLRMSGSSVDAMMNKQPWTHGTYLRVDKDTMDFVLARSTQGTCFEKQSITDRGSLTKEKVVKMVVDAG